MDSIVKIEARRTELRRELENLDKIQKELESMSSDVKLAIGIHALLCHHNHTDGCGWHYEIKNGKHDWNGSSHIPYLAKAIRMQNKFKGLLNEDQILDVIKTAQS